MFATHESILWGHPRASKSFLPIMHPFRNRGGCLCPFWVFNEPYALYIINELQSGQDFRGLLNFMIRLGIKKYIGRITEREDSRVESDHSLTLFIFLVKFDISI